MKVSPSSWEGMIRLFSSEGKSRGGDVKIRTVMQVVGARVLEDICCPYIAKGFRQMTLSELLHELQFEKFDKLWKG